MIPVYNVVYSPDDGGYYAEFWDQPTGKALVIKATGEDLMTKVYVRRHRANKIAKRVIRSLYTKPRLMTEEVIVLA